jgi:F-box and WD-40 domain protein CDC4
VSKKWYSIINEDMYLWRSRGYVDGLWDQEGYSLALRLRQPQQVYKIATTFRQRGIRLDTLKPFVHGETWQQLLHQPEFNRIFGSVAHGSPKSSPISPSKLLPSAVALGPPPHPFKHMYERALGMQQNWYSGEPKRTTFAGHASAVVTCLQFDDEKIVSGSDDQSICIYDIQTGKLIRQLDGHEGGVWALQYFGDTLVSGSTDRTVRVWNLKTGKMTHVFHGHTSTVRCLQLLLPVASGANSTSHLKTKHVASTFKGGYVSSSTWLPQASTPNLTEPLIITGSRDTTIRVWRLPEPDDPMYPPPQSSSSNPPQQASMSGTNSSSLSDLAGMSNEAGTPTLHSSTSGVIPNSSATSFGSATNPYFRHVLTGHSHSVRALAGHGNIVCSGSYDSTVRVWDVVKGECRWRLTGHTQKVYSIVFDGVSRCWSGSMDATVRCWDINTGQCIAVLEGHSSLVGLLEATPRYLVSAAADTTLRLWRTSDHQPIHTLQAHANAITCFQFDNNKIVSGSEGAVKLWDPISGKVIRDLIPDVANVWRLQISERWLVAAISRDGRTEFVVLDFDPETNSSSDTPVDPLSLNDVDMVGSGLEG